jgi:hypothetical protein
VTLTLQALLDEHAVDLPGRDAERKVLLDFALGERPLFMVVDGLAGTGKSALLRAFARDARAGGVRVLELDCRAIEPTERGFLDALGQVLDQPVGSVPAAAAALDALPGRTVLVLDPFDAIRLLDTWLRTRLVGRLPASSRLLLAARDGAPAWSRDFSAAVGVLPLRALAPAAARQVLRRAGVADDVLAQRVNRLARGHPLALQLAAGALGARPEPALPEAAVAPFMLELAEGYRAALDPDTRRALDAACMVRRATLSLLGAMLPGEPPADAFARLRRLPFAEVTLEGLMIHDTVREATAALLRAADPVRHRALRTAAWRQLRSELRGADTAQLWRYTADMLYLVEHPALHDAFFPSTRETFEVAPAQPADVGAIEAIVAQHRPPGAAALLSAYARDALHAFRVARNGAGQVAGYALAFAPGTVAAAVQGRDPVARAWREHRCRDPVPRGQTVFCIRDAAPRPDVAESATAALWLDVKRDYLELRPALRRVYVATPTPEHTLGALGRLGFAALGDSPVLAGEQPTSTLVLDMGPASVDGWLSDVVGRELQGNEDGVLDPARRTLSIAGREVELTRLEFDFLRYLRQREGEAVERGELLRTVWGYDWTGGSNVIEAVVSSLRRKLGERASALETVRGVGYRLRRLA